MANLMCANKRLRMKRTIKHFSKMSLKMNLDNLVGHSCFSAGAAAANSDQERFDELTLAIVPEILFAQH